MMPKQNKELEIENDVKKYINDWYSENMIQEFENKILSIMKLRQEVYPSEKNDEEWLNYTNFVCRRRCQRVSNDN